MADTFTPNYNFVLPEVGGSPDTWGGKLNQNFSNLDQALKAAIPQGVITLWSGATSAIPTGWALCDGQNGTPDLTDRFIVGAGGSYSPGDTGGVDSVTLTKAQMPAHSHGASTGNAGSHSHSASTGNAGNHRHSGSTNTTGNHSHYFAFGDNDPSPSGKDYGTNARIDGARAYTQSVESRGDTSNSGNHSHSFNTNYQGSHSHSVSINSSGSHSHSVSVSNTGGGGSHENRPPYYALAYIMKV